MAIFRREPPNVGWASNAGGVGRNRDSEPICLLLTRQQSEVLSTWSPVEHGHHLASCDIYITGRTLRVHSGYTLVVHIARATKRVLALSCTITIDRMYDSKAWRYAEDNRQNRIVCTSKYQAEVTNNKKLRLKYCTIDATKLTTDRHEASRGLFVTAELLVYFTAKHFL